MNGSIFRNVSMALLSFYILEWGGQEIVCWSFFFFLLGVCWSFFPTHFVFLFMRFCVCVCVFFVVQLFLNLRDGDLLSKEREGCCFFLCTSVPFFFVLPTPLCICSGKNTSNPSKGKIKRKFTTSILLLLRENKMNSRHAIRV